MGNKYISIDLARKLIRKAGAEGIGWAVKAIETLPAVEIGMCRDCIYFEYDHVEYFYHIPIIAAHEFCHKWGHGCQTKENGWCYLFEREEGKTNADSD